MKAIKQIFKQSICIIDYNGNIDFDLNNIVEFVNINLPYKKLSVQLLVNDSITYTKKRQILKIEDEVNKSLKSKIIWKKKILVK